MTKKKKKTVVKARNPTVLLRANAKLDPIPSEKIRVKKAPTKKPTKRAIQCRINSRLWRNGLDLDQKRLRYAIETASARYRKCIKPSGVNKKKEVKAALDDGIRRRNRQREPLSLRPCNFSELLALIPNVYRHRPTVPGQDAIYLLHGPKGATQWERGLVVAIRRHIVGTRASGTVDSNWMVVLKNPPPAPDTNPYLAIDSTNVFLAPPNDVETGIFKNSGVYVLYCESSDTFYVGESHNINVRLGQHDSGVGSQATSSMPTFHRLQPRTPRKAFKVWENEECALLRALYPNATVIGGGCSGRRSK